jgi:hypothetical protein
MENSYFIEKTLRLVDWSKVPDGTYMTAKIKGEYCEGVVWNNPTEPNSKKYFCQNDKSGSDAPFRFGFRYSWEFLQREDGTHTEHVTDIQFPPKPEDLIIPKAPPKPIVVTIGNGDHRAEVRSENTLVVGCQTITKEQILNVLKVMESIEE